MRALIEALVSLDQFESSAALLAAIMAFELVVLLLSLAGDARPNFDKDVVKYTMYPNGHSNGHYLSSYSLVVLLDIRDVKITIAIVYCYITRPGRRHGRTPWF